LTKQHLRSDSLPATIFQRVSWIPQQVIKDDPVVLTFGSWYYSIECFLSFELIKNPKKTLLNHSCERHYEVRTDYLC
jgi:hypothetical protein